ncbi:MAG: ferritin family protein [Magnetococcales bacterium]|nr:ferritin family protein [Magnetococcales bacterium]
MHSFEEIIQFAINHEEEEAAFYREMAARSRTADQRDIMVAHAREEEEHKRRLEAILAMGRLPSGGKRRFPDPDLKLADYLVAEERADGSIGYEEALLLAAKREKKAQRLYRELASQVTEEEARTALLFLAEQEGKHANALEREYDDTQP